MNKYARIGEDVVLTCVCVGDQQATVSWKENYIEISSITYFAIYICLFEIDRVITV